MKLNKETSPVLISGAVGAPSSFRINASKEAFSILSSGLYTNKIRAIIRELSCNAYDAHVAASKADQPFFVHLPTVFEPFFTVKDQGTGLEFIAKGCKKCSGSGKTLEWDGEQNVAVDCSQCGATGDYDAVRELCCTYFATDKSDSNLFVGALGLGSKSPFCYTQGFSFTNVYAGVTRVYSCFLNAQGMPDVLLQTETETPGEPNGVEVMFPVKQNDVWEFENQAGKVWEFFDPAPTTNFEIRIEKKDYSIRTDRWAVRKGDKHGLPRAIQGMVQYSIGDIDESKMTHDQRQIAKLPLDLFFPIGELGVAASREALSNDELTIQAILKALDHVKDGMLEDLKKQVAAAKSPWEARLIIYNAQDAEGVGSLVDRAFKAGEFTNINLNFTVPYQDYSISQIDYPKVAIHEFTRSFGGAQMFAHKQRRTRDLNPESVVNNPGKYDIDFPGDKPSLFVINDLAYGTDKYVHHLVQNDRSFDYKVVYLITRATKEVPWATVKQSGLQIVQAVGNPPMMLMSELKAMYKEEFTHTSPTQPARKVLRYNGSSKGWYSSWDDATNSELPAVKYYLPIKALEPQTGEFATTHQLRNFLSGIRGSKLFDITSATPIYGIPTWRLKDLDDTWVELFDHVMNKVVEFFTPENEIEYAYYLSSEAFSVSFETFSQLDRLAEDKGLPENCLLKQFAVRWKRCKASRKKMESVKELVTFAICRGRYTPPQMSVDFNKLWDEVTGRYPLLNYIRAWYSSNSRQLTAAITQYVSLVDGEEERQTEMLELPTFASLGVVQTEKKENDYVS